MKPTFLAVFVLVLSVALFAKPGAGPSHHKGGGGGTTTVSLNPVNWIDEDLDMPIHPSALGGGMAGWFFQFPTWPNLVGYLVTPFTGNALGKSVTFTAQVVTESGSPIYDYATPGNTCTFPAHTRAFLSNGSNPFDTADTGRWWSNPVAFELDDNNAGTFTVTTPVDPSQWSDVDGQFGSAVLQAFDAAFTSPQWVGLTFGGGCFFGHGVGIHGGTAKFVLTNYAVQ